MTKRQPICVLGMCILGITIIFGCASIERDWQTARQLDTIDAYLQFLVRHTSSEFDDRLKNRLAELTWQKVQKSDDIRTYMKFANSYEGTEVANKALEYTRMIVKDHWKPLSTSESELVKTNIIDRIQKKHRHYEGNILYQEVTNETNNVIIQIAASDVLYLGNTSFFYFSSGSIMVGTISRRYGPVCLFEGEIYEIVSK